MRVFFYIILLCFFVDFWSLEVTFSVILVSFGRLWTCLVPGGSRDRSCRINPKCPSPFDSILELFLE